MAGPFVLPTTRCCTHTLHEQAFAALPVARTDCRAPPDAFCGDVHHGSQAFYQLYYLYFYGRVARCWWRGYADVCWFVRCRIYFCAEYPHLPAPTTASLPPPAPALTCRWRCVLSRFSVASWPGRIRRRVLTTGHRCYALPQTGKLRTSFDHHHACHTAAEQPTDTHLLPRALSYSRTTRTTRRWDGGGCHLQHATGAVPPAFQPRTTADGRHWRYALPRAQPSRATHHNPGAPHAPGALLPAYPPCHSPILGLPTRLHFSARAVGHHALTLARAAASATSQCHIHTSRTLPFVHTFCRRRSLFAAFTVRA